jgi:HEAT repeat protein
VALAVDGTATAGADRQVSLSGTLALEGELELRSYGRTGDAGDQLLGARLARLTRLDWSFGGEPLLPDGGRAVAGPELMLVVAPDGAFRSLDVPRVVPPFVPNLFRILLAPLEVVVASGERAWTRQQTNPLGDLEAAYEVRASRPGSLALHRRPLRYTRLAAGRLVGGGGADPTGTFDLLLDRAGHLVQVLGEERVDVPPGLRQRTRLEARLLSVVRAPGPAAPRARAELVSSGLGDVTVSPDALREAREGRIAGLTMERLVQDLFIHGPSEHFPEPGQWMWRATGLLLQHPERCRELVAVFRSPGMTERARGRVLDLLAGTGSPEAQAVLRELVETPESRGAKLYPLFVQRLSLVEVPTDETIEYLRAKVGRGDGENTLAAAHSLGEAIGKRSRLGGEVDGGAAALLRAGLAGARSAQERRDWLGALGNAGLERDTALIASHASDGDPAVRAEVAASLRKIRTPDARRVLLGLAADDDPRVQGRALQALARHEIGATELEALRRQVVDGQLAPSTALMNLLETHRKQPDAVLPVLDAMSARGVSDKHLLARMRALRAALSPR